MRFTPSVTRISQLNRLLASSTFANLGDGIASVALALVTVGLTRSPAVVAGVALANRLPWLFLALPAGALADRLDRRRTMVLVEVARVGAFASLAGAAATDTLSIALIYAVAVVLGVSEVFFDTAAQTLLPAVVDRDDLSRANGRLFGAEIVTNQFVGPPLGGFLVAVSATAAFGVGAVLYGVAAGALLTLRGSFRTARADDVAGRGALAGLTTDIREGMRFLFGHRLLRTLGMLLGAQNLLFVASYSMMVLYATADDGLGLSSAGVGFLLTTGAIGGLVGSLVAAPAERLFGRARLLALCLSVGAACMAVPGVTSAVLLVAASSVVGGAGAVIWNVITVSLRQRIIPDELLGRVNSGYRLLGWGTMPLGAALGGALGETFGLRPVFLVCAAAMAMLIPVLVTIVTDRAIDDAEADATRETEPMAPAAQPA